MFKLALPSRQRANTAHSENFYQFAHVGSSNTVNRTTTPRMEPGSLQDLSTSPILEPSEKEESYDTEKYHRASVILLATSVFSAVLILVFESYMYAVLTAHREKIHSQQHFVEIAIYFSLFIFAAVYQVILTVVGIRTKNMLILTMLCGFYACMLVYTGIQYHEVGSQVALVLYPAWRTATQATNIATIAVIAITLLIQMFVIFVLLRGSVQWYQFKRIGADPHIRNMYTVYQVHRCLLIFDFFFFLGFTVQFIVIMVARKTSVEFILTLCMLPLSIVLLVVSDFAASRENKPITVATIVLFLGGCAYMLFKMIRLYTKYTSAYDVAIKPGGYFPGRKSLIVFGSVALALLLSTAVCEITFLFNYGRGLLLVVGNSYSWVPFCRKEEQAEQAILEEELKDEDSLMID